MTRISHVVPSPPQPSLPEGGHHQPTRCGPPKPPFPANGFSIPPPPPNGFSTILAIAIVGITITAVILVCYYVFVIKCCLNRHRFDLLRRFSVSQARRHEDPIMVYSSSVVSRGLDEALIRAIPIIRFKKGGDSSETENMNFVDCAVCLNEFQEDENLRVLPNCTHAFHIDCIDVWLQSNANCPLCRSSIIPMDQSTSPSSSSQDSTSFSETIVSSDEDFVVIELRDEQSIGQTSHRRQRTGNSGEISLQSISPSTRKLEERLVPKKARKFHHMSIIGDECIDVRSKDDLLSFQPIRRSFSMDSSADRQLCLSVREIIQTE